MRIERNWMKKEFENAKYEFKFLWYVMCSLQYVTIKQGENL